MQNFLKKEVNLRRGKFFWQIAVFSFRGAYTQGYVCFNNHESTLLSMLLVHAMRDSKSVCKFSEGRWPPLDDALLERKWDFRGDVQGRI